MILYKNPIWCIAIKTIKGFLILLSGASQSSSVDGVVFLFFKKNKQKRNQENSKVNKLRAPSTKEDHKMRLKAPEKASKI